MLYLGADHNGFWLKEELKDYLHRHRISFKDMGAFAHRRTDDYPDFGVKVARRIGVGDIGILICGSGAGVAIVANKFKAVRAATLTNREQARMARSDEDINILALPADFIDFPRAKEIVDAFLTTPFSNAERHARRLAKIPP